MPEEFKRLDRTLKYEGSIINFYKDTVLVPNGNIVHWDFIGHKGAAAVVPVMDDGRILMVRQYRNALDRYTLEIPAGGLDSKDEPFIECSLRELEEETGYKTDKANMEFLISIRTTVAFCDEKIEVYVAKNLKPSVQHLDEDEFINVKPYTVEELCEKIYAGEIEDSKTISSIMAYKNKYLK
ncbi:MAG: NUDIX hydrolase [Lachnospiraceae bacterium]|nr:NUDIX hydrolase [Lachnospiraceae bacterium]